MRPAGPVSSRSPAGSILSSCAGRNRVGGAGAPRPSLQGSLSGRADRRGVVDHELNPGPPVPAVGAQMAGEVEEGGPAGEKGRAPGGGEAGEGGRPQPPGRRRSRRRAAPKGRRPPRPREG